MAQENQWQIRMLKEYLKGKVKDDVSNSDSSCSGASTPMNRIATNVPRSYERVREQLEANKPKPR